MLRRPKISFKLDANVGSGYEGKLDDVAGKILIIAKSRPVVQLSLQVSIEGQQQNMKEIEALANRAT